MTGASGTLNTVPRAHEKFHVICNLIASPVQNLLLQGKVSLPDEPAAAASGASATAASAADSANKPPTQQQQQGRLVRETPGFIVDPYVPVPKELLPSALTVAGIKARWARLGRTVRSTLAVAMVKRSIPSFKPIEFAVDAQELFIKTNKALANDDKLALRELVTDQAYVEFRNHFRGQHKWELKEVVERPRLVHMTAFALTTKKDLCAQAVVRVNLKQILRLKPSHSAEPKAVEEYVVLERHISMGPKSKWRVCGKIVPTFVDLSNNARHHAVLNAGPANLASRGDGSGDGTTPASAAAGKK